MGESVDKSEKADLDGIQQQQKVIHTPEGMGVQLPGLIPHAAQLHSSTGPSAAPEALQSTRPRPERIPRPTLMKASRTRSTSRGKAAPGRKINFQTAPSGTTRTSSWRRVGLVERPQENRPARNRPHLTAAPCGQPEREGERRRGRSDGMKVQWPPSLPACLKMSLRDPPIPGRASGPPLLTVGGQLRASLWNGV